MTTLEIPFLSRALRVVLGGEPRRVRFYAPSGEELSLEVARIEIEPVTCETMRDLRMSLTLGMDLDLQVEASVDALSVYSNDEHRWVRFVREPGGDGVS